MRILSQAIRNNLPRQLQTLATEGMSAILELVLPSSCRFCNQPVASQADFCRQCELQLTISQVMMESACLRCGTPSPKAAGEEVKTADFQSSCVHCCKLKYHFEGVAGLWAYQGRVCDAVVAAKHAHCSPLGDALGRRLGQRVASVFSDDLPDIVTTVPSHGIRRLQRGGTGNQAIADAVAKKIGRPLGHLLRASRRTQKQAWLDDNQRQKNVRDAFSRKKSYAFSRLPELDKSHVMVVDDVLTTGATANEAARILREAGAKRVSLAVVARAIRS